MSMCGYMTKEDKEEWYQKNRQAQIDSAEAWKQEQEAKTGGQIVRSTRENAGRNGCVDYTSPPKERPGAPKPAGRDLTQCSAKERMCRGEWHESRSDRGVARIRGQSRARRHVQV